MATLGLVAARLPNLGKLLSSLVKCLNKFFFFLLATKDTYSLTKHLLLFSHLHHQIFALHPMEKIRHRLLQDTLMAGNNKGRS